MGGILVITTTLWTRRVPLCDGGSVSSSEFIYKTLPPPREKPEGRNLVLGSGVPVEY